MTPSETRPVVAIGLDAAEPTLVRELIERDRLPVLANVMEGGSWSRVVSPAYIGSGCVWPTFTTGSSPLEHQLCGWRWLPERMAIAPRPTPTQRSFWAQLDDRGHRVGVIDVPFSPRPSLSRGFEVWNWGSHDVTGSCETSPPELAGEIAADPGPHPFLDELPPHLEAATDAQLDLTRRCVDGARMRGRLAARLLAERRPALLLVAFSEIHHASHRLWHTVDPAHPVYRGERTAEPLLERVFTETDRAVGEILEAVGGEPRVAVFALHGMRPTHGLPAFLDPLLAELGIARPARGVQSRRGWAEPALALLKRKAPARAKRLYHRTAPRSVVTSLARPVLGPYDWRSTRAFVLPSDQHGWIRVNLRGREAAGIVAPSAYEETCDEVEAALRGLATPEGRPLVRDVLRPSDQGSGPPPSLPDLVVHWDEAAHEDPVRVRGTSVEARPTATYLTGQHTLEGFLLGTGLDDVGDAVRAEELQRVLTPAAAEQPAKASGGNRTA